MSGQCPTCGARTGFGQMVPLVAQPAQAVDAERLLAALGHVRVQDKRCLARVAEPPRELRPPGPHNPPIWCCLQAGHDGPHRHDGGGMYASIPFRDTYEVVMVPLPDYCEKCNRVWPCDDAKAVTRALFGQVGPAGDGLALPFDEDVQAILGRMCFQCIRLAHRLRQLGHVIENRAEAEQAAVLHWMLNHYLKHGKDWHKFADAELNAAPPTPDKEG